MRSSKRVTARLGAVAAVACTVGLFLPVAAESAGAVVAASGPGAYHPLTPTRVTDTRRGSGAPNSGAPVGPAGTVTVDVSTSVAPTATAVALSVTAVDGTSNSFLSVYPAGQVPLTPTSVLNYVAGPGGAAFCTTPDCTVPNLVVSKLNGGKVTVANGSPTGSVDVVVDVEGYFDPTNATTSGAGHFLPMAPSRVVDTRCSATPAPGVCADEQPFAMPSPPKLGPNGTLDVFPTGVPMAGQGISAVVVQLTATNTTANGFLTAFAGDQTTPPNASNVNFVAGQTSSTRAIVPVGLNGDIKIFNRHGNTDVIVDFVGIFSDATGSAADGSLYTPIVPTRLTDTRMTDAGALGANTSVTFPVAGQASIPAQVNGSPTAATLNVTEASATATSYLTVTPDTLTPPASTSDVNFNRGEIRANTDLAELGSPNGTVSIYNNAGTTQVAVDAFGYFSAAPPPHSA